MQTLKSDSTVLRDDATVKPFTFNRASILYRAVRRPLRRQVLDELRQSIIAGRLAPGLAFDRTRTDRHDGRLPNSDCEALRQMESEGLVANIPDKGPVVRELTLAEAKDLYSIRAVLEGLAACLFTETPAPRKKNFLSKP